MTTRRRPEPPKVVATSRSRTGAEGAGEERVSAGRSIWWSGVALLLAASIGGTGCTDRGLLSPETPTADALPLGHSTSQEPEASVLAEIEFQDDSRIEFELVDNLIIVFAEGASEAEAFKNGVEGREHVDPVTLYESITKKPAPDALVGALHGGRWPAVVRKTEAAVGSGFRRRTEAPWDADGGHGDTGLRGSCDPDAFARNHCRSGYDFQFCFPSVHHDYRRTEDAKYARAIVQSYSGRVTMTLEYESGGRWRTKASQDISACTSYTAYVNVWEWGGGGLTAAIPIRVKVEWSEGDHFGVSFFGYR